MILDRDLTKCDPQDVSLKTFFLGPQAENKEWVLEAVTYLFQQWFSWRENYFPKDGVAITQDNRIQTEFVLKQNSLMELLKVLSKRFEDEVPKFTPRYVGHMFSEFSLPALMGHILTLLHNPNNISGEASKVGIQIEREAIDDLCKMVGWNSSEGTGHFTSGGTIANFESLLRAKNRLYLWLGLGTYLKEKRLSDHTLFQFAQMGWEQFDLELSRINNADFTQWKEQWLVNPIRFANHVSQIFQVTFEGPVLLVPQSKHYSWPKGTQLLGMGSDRLVPINLTQEGRMDVNHLKEVIEMCKMQNLPIAGVVSVAGTTELGTIDPINEINDELKNQTEQGYYFWHHVDAAYGGFLCSMIGMEPEDGFSNLLNKLKAIRFVNSVTIDPHKLGYVPYSSGVILVQNPREYAYQDIQAPYIQFNASNDVGLQTLEGSRSAAGAVATWLTERSIGLNPEGYGRLLARTISVRKLIASKLNQASSKFVIVPGLDTNVLCFCVVLPGDSLSQINQRVQEIYNQFSPNAKAPFIFSKTQIKTKNYGPLIEAIIKKHEIKDDTDELFLLRLCLMNPFMVSKETNISYTDELIQALKSAIE